MAKYTMSLYPKAQVVGQSALYLDCLSHASQLAELDRPVLILGERGSGKELIAERMHFLSPRWEEPFLKLNCAALTESLVESSLFGHEAGAFTGAQKHHEGYFERVQSGTLFLDEIATLSLRVQEKLLRVLEYGEFERIGGNKVLHTNGRIVAATHSDIQSMANSNEFRHDLLDRLAFDVVHVPPLRNRDTDVLLLAEHFALSFVSQLSWEYFPGFSEKAKSTLVNYGWPGNVRELKNVVERSLFRWGTPNQEVEEIIIDPFAFPWNTDQHKSIPSSLETSSEQEEENYHQDFKTLRLRWELKQLEKAMKKCNNHQGKAAAALSLSYDQFRAIWRKRDQIEET